MSRAVGLLLVLVVFASRRATADDDAAVRVVESVGPAVASVVAEPRRGEARHVGSAVVVDPAGFLLTNAHVVDGAARIVVALPGRPPLEGTLLATAPDDDLALLRVDAGVPLPVARLAAGEVKVGQSCLAIGNALGLDATVTRGIISARGRRLVHDGRQLGSDFLQTDAAIHPGSSGGPLVDLTGAVIGITTAVEQDAPGVGFAIPTARARRVLAALSSPLLLRDRWLGLEVEDAPGGARVVAIVPGGPAEAAGLRMGDVIVSAGPLEVASAFHLHARFLGDEARAVRLAVIGADGVRRGAHLAPAAPPWTSGLRRRLGVTLRAAAGDAGLFVAAVDPGSPAAVIGLQPGDRLVRTGRQGERAAHLDGAEALWAVVQALDAGAPLGVTVVRAGREYWGEMRIR